jgi:hypothetical protein
MEKKWLILIVGIILVAGLVIGLVVLNGGKASPQLSPAPNQTGDLQVGSIPQGGLC